MDIIMDNATIVEENVQFTLTDYSLFLLMLISSAIIGIYFGFFNKKESTADEYLLGGKEMNVFPIAMSLIASYVSGITILAVPADVYQFGSTYWFGAVGIALNCILTLIVYLPVFYKLQLTSTFEYLSMRFGRSLRILASFLFTASAFLYLPIVIYLPALALSQGTGFNVHLITPIVCGVCIFYTTIGGLKAVVWTDTLQFVIMIGATLITIYLGTVSQGGVFEVFKIANAGHRLDIDFNLDPTIRDSFWSCFIGLFAIWTSVIGISQGCIQKCLALPTMNDVKKAFAIFGFGMVCFFSFSVYTGLLIYGKYHDCDVLASKQIDKMDQILPLYVLQVARDIPGLPGLFIAGVFSASLSSLSAAMNCLGCTIYEDFISQWVSKDISQQKVSYILKWIVVIIGIICTALVFLVERMGNILSLGLSLGGVTAGPVLGLFTLGMVVPSANKKGALYGTIGSLLTMIWIIMGSQIYKMNNLIVYETKPISVEGCPTHMNLADSIHRETSSEAWFIYRVSHYYYTIMGFMLVFLIGIPISKLTNSNDPAINKDLISPIMHWAMTDIDDSPPDYYSVEKAMQMVDKPPSNTYYK